MSGLAKPSRAFFPGDAILPIAAWYVNNLLEPPSDDNPYNVPADLTSGEPHQGLNDRVCLIRADITRLGVDAIVNAANEEGLGGGGIDGAINKAGGPKLEQARKRLPVDGQGRRIQVGTAVSTPGFDLPAKHVIHTVGPNMRKADHKQHGAQYLEMAYDSCLQEAARLGAKILVFNCISTGIYRFPHAEACWIAASRVRRFLEHDPNGYKVVKVVFCVFDDKDVEPYNDIIPRIFPPTAQDLTEALSRSRSEDPSSEQPADTENPPAPPPDTPGKELGFIIPETLAPEGPEEEKLYDEIKKYGTMFIMQRHDPDYEPSEEADDYLWEFSQDVRNVFKMTERDGHGTMYIEEGDETHQILQRWTGIDDYPCFPYIFIKGTYIGSSKELEWLLNDDNFLDACEHLKWYPKLPKEEEGE